MASLAGNTIITAPQLIVNGALSPGTNGVGAMTNSGTTTLGAGGRYLWDIQDGLGNPGTAWDLLQSGGVLDIQATSGNPFTIVVQSVEDVLQGLPDFDNNVSYNWVIALGAGVANFAPSKFAVNSSAFADDLAGGYFYVSSSGSSLNLSFTNNHPPVASDVLYYRSAGSTLQIPISALTAHWSDPDGDPVVFSGVQANSANGNNNVSSDGYLYLLHQFK